jgi:hypothetical protein
MELERFAYKAMLKWKSARETGVLDGYPRISVLQIEGAKRSGKTFLA